MRQASLALETEPPSSELTRRVSRQLSTNLGLPSPHELAKAHPHLSNLGRGPKSKATPPRPPSQRKRSPLDPSQALAAIPSGIPLPGSTRSVSSFTHSPSTTAPHSLQGSPTSTPRAVPHSAVPAPHEPSRTPRHSSDSKRAVRFSEDVALPEATATRAPSMTAGAGVQGAPSELPSAAAANGINGVWQANSLFQRDKSAEQPSLQQMRDAQPELAHAPPSPPQQQQPQQPQQQPIGTVRMGRLNLDDPAPTALLSATLAGPLDAGEPPSSQQDDRLKSSAAAGPGPGSDPSGPHFGGPRREDRAVGLPDSNGGVGDHELGGSGRQSPRRRPERNPTPQVLQQLQRASPGRRSPPLLAPVVELSEDGSSLPNADSLRRATAGDARQPDAVASPPSAGPTWQSGPHMQIAPQLDLPGITPDSIGSSMEPAREGPQPIPSPQIVQLPTPFAAVPVALSRTSSDAYQQQHLTAANGIPMGDGEVEEVSDAQAGTMPHLLRTLMPYSTASVWRGAT